MLPEEMSSLNVDGYVAHPLFALVVLVEYTIRYARLLYSRGYFIIMHFSVLVFAEDERRPSLARLASRPHRRPPRGHAQGFLWSYPRAMPSRQ